MWQDSYLTQRRNSNEDKKIRLLSDRSVGKL
jgi:hypothetical protein